MRINPTNNERELLSTQDDFAHGTAVMAIHTTTLNQSTAFLSICGTRLPTNPLASNQSLPTLDPTHTETAKHSWHPHNSLHICIEYADTNINNPLPKKRACPCGNETGTCAHLAIVVGPRCALLPPNTGNGISGTTTTILLLLPSLKNDDTGETIPIVASRCREGRHACDLDRIIRYLVTPALWDFSRVVRFALRDGCVLCL